MNGLGPESHPFSKHLQPYSFVSQPMLCAEGKDLKHRAWHRGALCGSPDLDGGSFCPGLAFETCPLLYLMQTQEPSAACLFAHCCRMAVTGRSLPQQNRGKELSLPHLQVSTVFSAQEWKMKHTWPHTLQGREGRVRWLSEPPTIPTDVCPSHYKNCSEEWYHIPAKIPCPDKPLHTNPFHPKVPICLCFKG